MWVEGMVESAVVLLLTALSVLRAFRIYSGRSGTGLAL